MRIVSFVSALLILCSTLAVPAMAAEVWVVDLDSSPVVVSEDGTETSVPSSTLADPEFSLLDPEPDWDTLPAVDPESAAPSSGSSTVPDTSPAPAPEDDFLEEDPLPTYDEYFSDYAASYSVMSVADLDDPVSFYSGSGEGQSMKEVIVQVFGEYTPRTQTVTQYLSDGSVLDTATEIVPGVAGMDWQWISGVVLFSVMLFSFLKMVGVLLKNG